MDSHSAGGRFGKGSLSGTAYGQHSIGAARTTEVQRSFLSFWVVDGDFNGADRLHFYESTPPEKYATFFCSVYDDETGRLTYTNAGHPKPILAHRGQAIPLQGDGIVAGLLPNVKYEQQDVLLQPGDLLAVFSDGVPEAQDAAEQEFGEARLAELLRDGQAA